MCELRNPDASRQAPRCPHADEAAGGWSWDPGDQSRIRSRSRNRTQRSTQQRSCGAPLHAILRMDQAEEQLGAADEVHVFSGAKNPSSDRSIGTGKWK